MKKVTLSIFATSLLALLGTSNLMAQKNTEADKAKSDTTKVTQKAGGTANYMNLAKDDELDYSVQQKILDFGFIDALKEFHPSFIATAPTKMFYDQSNHPLRYDYLYVSKNLKEKLVKCEVIKDNFTDIYSDHYPVILTIKK